MGHEIVYCVRCQTQLRGPDFDKGKAFRMGSEVFCEKCIREAVPGFTPEDVKRPPGSTPPGMRAALRQPSTRKLPAVAEAKAKGPPYLLLAGIAFVLAVIVGGVALKSRPSGPPSSEPSPAPATGPEAEALKALKEARTYAAAHPDDHAGQISRFERARVAATGTKLQAEAKEELTRAQERRDELVRVEGELELLIRDAAAKEDFRRVFELLDAAGKRSPSSRWTPWADARRKAAEAEREQAYQAAKAEALRLKAAGDDAGVKVLRSRVGMWGVSALNADLDAALGKAAPPAPAPAPAPTPAGTAALGPFQQSADGRVVMEAEHYSSAVSVATHAWVGTTAPAGSSGGSAMQVMPDVDEIVWKRQSEVMKAPRLDFAVNFVKPGTCYVWIRGMAPGPVQGRSNTVHIGLDGSIFAQAVGKFEAFLIWCTMGAGGKAASFTVDKPGLHTINLWPREDGVVVDKIHISLVPDVPGGDPRSAGPPESPHGK